MGRRGVWTSTGSNRPGSWILGGMAAVVGITGRELIVDAITCYYAPKSDPDIFMNSRTEDAFGLSGTQRENP